MRQKNGRWYIAWTEYHRGEDGQLAAKRVERAAGADKKQAQAEEDRQKDFWESVKLGRTPPADFDRLMLEYLLTQQDTPAYKSKLSNAKHLRDAFTGRQIADIKPADIRRYAARRQEQGAAPSTINHEIQLLSAAIKRANRLEDWNLPNPCQGSRVSPGPARVRWLTAEEQARLLQAAATVDHAPLLQHWVAIAVNTGMRYREITELEWARIDLNHRLIHLEPAHNKTRQRRAIPLNQGAVLAILTIRDFHQANGIEAARLFVTRDGRAIKTLGKRAFQKACELAGLDDLTMRDLRHVAASAMVQAGATLQEVKEVLGHKSISTTEVYAHLSPDAARSAVDRLDRAEKKRKVGDGNL